jgi:hypothetical protein
MVRGADGDAKADGGHVVNGSRLKIYAALTSYSRACADMDGTRVGDAGVRGRVNAAARTSSVRAHVVKILPGLATSA